MFAEEITSGRRRPQGTQRFHRLPRAVPGPPGTRGCGCPRAGQGDGAAAFPCPGDAPPVRPAPVLSQPARAPGKDRADHATGSPWGCWSRSAAAVCGVSGARRPPPALPPRSLRWFERVSLAPERLGCVARPSSHPAASPAASLGRGFQMGAVSAPYCARDDWWRRRLWCWVSLPLFSCSAHRPLQII